MDGAFGAPRPRRRAIVNITPLIDVMFLLLIFFMVSATFREHLGIQVDLPQATTATGQEITPREIVVDAEGQYFFEGQHLDASGLEAAIAAALEEAPDDPIILSADENSRFNAYITAFDIVRRVGGGKLVVLTQPRGK